MSIHKISDKIDIHSLSGLNLKIFLALDYLTNAEKDRFSLAEISNFLIEKMRVGITKQAIYSSLKKNKKSCNKNSKGYKLMDRGLKELEKSNSAQNIILIEPNKPFLGKKIVADEIFKGLKGTIKICDPYFTIKILDHVYSFFNKSQNIEILTKNIVDKPAGSILRTLVDLRKEGYSIEVKIYKNSELHDRYIIDDKNGWLSGCGFNDIGQKECFFVLLGEDFRQSILSTFNNRWKSSDIYK